MRDNFTPAKRNYIPPPNARPRPGRPRQARQGANGKKQTRQKDKNRRTTDNSILLKQAVTMALILAGAAAYAAYTAAQQGEESSDAGIPDVDDSIDLSGKTFVDLLPLELTLDYFEASISTVTFVEGNYKDATPLIKKRMSEIVYRNPFLGGWLIKMPGDKYPKLVFDPSSDDVCEGMVEVLEPGQVNLSSETPYQEYGDIIGDHGKVPVCMKVINRKGQPLFRAALIPDALRPTEGFAVVVSMSRQCGDPHTFYRLYDMLLSRTAAIEPLNPIRKHKFSEACVEVMGEQEAFYVAHALSPSWWEYLVNKEENPIRTKIFFISRDWIEKQKIQENSDPSLLSDHSVAASWFFNLNKPTVGFVPYNFRNSLPQVRITDRDAGNYHNTIPYTSVDYATSGLVEKSFAEGKRCGANSNESLLPLPRFARDATYSVVPDWSPLSDSPKRSILNDGKFQQTLHLPLYNSGDLRLIPNKLSFLNMFIASASDDGDGGGRLGAFVVAPESIMPDIESCGIVEELIAEF